MAHRRQEPGKTGITTLFFLEVKFGDYALFHVMVNGTSHFLILPRCLVFWENGYKRNSKKMMHERRKYIVFSRGNNL